MKSRGISLIEILVAGGTSIIIGTFLLGIFSNNNNLSNSQSAAVEQGLNLNDAMQTISAAIREAQIVADKYPDPSPTIFTGDGTLILKLPAYNEEGTISNTYDYAIVTKDNNKPNILRMQILPAPASSRQERNQVLTALLDEVIFSYLDKSNNPVQVSEASAVKVTLSLSSKSGLSESKRSSSEVVNLRNN